MSVLATAEPTAADRAGPGRPDAPPRNARGSDRLRSRRGGGPAPEPSAADAGNGVAVTISVAPGALLHHPDVLDALRAVLSAAGPNVATQDAPVAPVGGTGSVTGDTGAGDIVVGDAVRIDPGTRTVTRGGRSLRLSRLEYDLLLFLVSHPRRVFTRAQLMSQIWGYAGAGERTVDVHVSRLRTKLGESPPVITTVYGIGYRLAVEAPIVVDPA